MGTLILNVNCSNILNNNIFYQDTAFFFFFFWLILTMSLSYAAHRFFSLIASPFSIRHLSPKMALYRIPKRLRFESTYLPIPLFEHVQDFRQSTPKAPRTKFLKIGKLTYRKG